MTGFRGGLTRIDASILASYLVGPDVIFGAHDEPHGTELIRRRVHVARHLPHSWYDRSKHVGTGPW